MKALEVNVEPIPPFEKRYLWEYVAHHMQVFDQHPFEKQLALGRAAMKELVALTYIPMAKDKRLNEIDFDQTVLDQFRKNRETALQFALDEVRNKFARTA